MADQTMAYWRLDETNGTVAYDFAGGNDGIYTNVALGLAGYNPLDADTAAGFGSLSASDSYVGGIPIDFSTSSNAAFSVEAWVNGAAQNGDNGIVTKGSGLGGEQFDLDTGSGNQAFRFFVRDSSGGAHLANGAIAPDGKWHHLVGVCDQVQGFVILYVDGVLNAHGNLARETGIQSSGIPVSIGSRQSGTDPVHDLQFVGTIDEVAIYNKVLSAARVRAHYQAGTNQVVLLSLTNASNGPVQLNWVWPKGILQSGTNLAGPYTDLPAAVSPYALTQEETNRFYRLRIPVP
jgi:hypothetical protein